MSKYLICSSILSLALFACGGDDQPTPDAAQIDAPPGPDAPPQVSGTCESYCTSVTANCVDPNDQYADNAACLDYCQNASGWEPGYEDDTAGNTIGCRTYHANAAADDAATHCPHAGPSGANVCGSWCDVYCATIMNNCVDANAQYADLAACTTTCAGLAADGQPGDAAGDTVQCRIYHAGAAAGDPATHCPHAGEDGGGVCVAQ